MNESVEAMFELVRDYHSASMGDDSSEIKTAELRMNEMREFVGESVWAEAIDKMNEIIRKAK